MRLPSPTHRTVLPVLFVALAFGVGTATAQPGLDPVGSYARYVGSLFGLLVVLGLGLLAVVFAPDYVERTAADLGERPVECFLYGLFALVVTVVLVFLMVATVVGMLGFVVLVPAAIVVGVLAHVVVSTWLGRALFTDDRSLTVDYLVGAAIVLVVSLLPLVGGLIDFVVTCLGTGVVLGSWWEAR